MVVFVGPGRPLADIDMRYFLFILVFLAGCSTSYEARVRAFDEALQKAQERECIPDYVWRAHRKVWAAADTDSLVLQTISHADQELEALRQSCGYLK